MSLSLWANAAVLHTVALKSITFVPRVSTSVSFLDHRAGNKPQVKMTRRLKIAAKLFHPSLGPELLWLHNLPLTPSPISPPCHEMNAYPSVHSIPRNEPVLPVN